jgi:hypothetical protein
MSEAASATKSKLLFGPSARVEVADLAYALAEELAGYGLAIEHEQAVPGQFLILTTETVQVLVAQVGRTLDRTELFGARRPEAAETPPDELRRRLDAHRSIVKIAVADRPDSQVQLRPALREQLCRDLTAAVSEELGAGLVVWAPDATLYAAEEFIGITGQMPEAEATGLQTLLAASDEPVSRPSCPAWQSVSRGLAPAELEDASEDEILTPSFVRRVTCGGLLLILAVISFPLAVGTMVYNVMRGADAHSTGQVVAVSALFTALEVAAIWSFWDMGTGLL